MKALAIAAFVALVATPAAAFEVPTCDVDNYCTKLYTSRNGWVDRAGIYPCVDRQQRLYDLIKSVWPSLPPDVQRKLSGPPYFYADSNHCSGYASLEAGVGVELGDEPGLFLAIEDARNGRRI
jgi:hypothetical protein